MYNVLFHHFCSQFTITLFKTRLPTLFIDKTAGRNKASSVPVVGHRVFHISANGIEVPRYPGAAGARAARLRAPRAPLPRTSRYGAIYITSSRSIAIVQLIMSSEVGKLFYLYFFCWSFRFYR